MTHPTQNHNDILYELAIAIGNSIDLHEMLRESLMAMMRKLDGIAVAVLDNDNERIAAYPRRGFKANYIPQISEQAQADSDCYLLHQSIENAEIYVFELPQTGRLIFVRRKPLNATLVKLLGPVCRKLANSIQACLASSALLEKEHALSESLVKLQLAQKSKDRFLANMSHEIRTPLNGVLGFIEQLKHTPLNFEQKNFVNIIDKSSNTLLGVINDILDFSKIESGQFELDEHLFNLYDELMPAIELFKCRASEKNLLLEIAIENDCQRAFKGDSLRIKQVVSNLVSNSIKFTQSGSVSVKVSCASANKEGIVPICFEVCDSGIGIPAERISSIFEPFTQADKSTSRNFGGTGLGLSISRELVSLMGGELQIESVVNQGTRFYFELCLQEICDSLEDAKQKVWEYDLSNRKVLLVEDNKVNQLLMSAVLRKENLAYDLAEDGQQAYEMYLAAEYDLIFMDINMPIMDGIESFKLIQGAYETGQHSYVPVVSLTANALVGDCESYKKMGMQDCLTKPLNLNELKRVLARFFPKAAAYNNEKQ